jgi:regulator of RNase E activity RraA
MNIIELAKQAGFKRHQEQAPGIDGAVGNWADLEAFANLVAAHEREECAKLCDKLEQQVRNMWHGQACAGCAVTIRARNNDTLGIE